MALGNTRIKRLPIALFFYVGELTQVQVEAVEKRYTAAGYTTMFRRQVDPVGKRDVIEFTATLIGGTYPSIYTTKFSADPTKVFDNETLAAIEAETAAEPPAPPSSVPAGRMASRGVETDEPNANVTEGTGVQGTTNDALIPADGGVKQAAPPTPPAPTGAPTVPAKPK